MKKIISGMLLLSAAGYLSSCYYDKEEELYPGPATCDTSNVTYTTTVKAIVQNNCATVGCHDNANMAGGWDLSNLNRLKQVAENGYLYGVVNAQSGYIPMPPNGLQLSACDKIKINTWIDKGTPE